MTDMGHDSEWSAEPLKKTTESAIKRWVYEKWYVLRSVYRSGDHFVKDYDLNNTPLILYMMLR